MIKLMVGDIISTDGGGYPDHKVVVVMDKAVALERMDGVLEPLSWYSDDYIKRMLDNDWSIDR